MLFGGKYVKNTFAFMSPLLLFLRLSKDKKKSYVNMCYLASSYIHVGTHCKILISRKLLSFDKTVSI